jgi:CDP-diacylglycerol--glycerol-3-phosphate 3-phosphatidyltransferase
MNLPNRLTAARLVMVPVFMIFVNIDHVLALALALVTFVAAGVTDLYDGYLARKYDLVTALGVFMDPLADKLIITAAFISFVELSHLHIPAWMVVLIVGREFLITGLRSLAASRGELVPADDGGKFKTAIQTVAIITILVVLIIDSSLRHFWGISISAPGANAGWRAAAANVLEWIPFWMVFIATLFSLITGISYLRKHKSLLQEAA